MKNVAIKVVAGLALSAILTSTAAADSVQGPVLRPSTNANRNARISWQHVVDDINGDGTSDLLWVNPAGNQFAYWTLQDNGFSLTRSGYKTYNVTPGYVINAVGDFNGDGKADLMWTSPANDLYLWTSTGNAFSSTYLGTYPAGWKLIGAGDVNGDGTDDLLWSNPDTCQFGYWLMKNGQRIGMSTYNVNCAYHVAGVGYFRSPDKLDLVWTSDANDVYLWRNNGTAFTSYFVGNLPAGYHIAGVSNGLGTGGDMDLVLIDSDTGQMQVWTWQVQTDANGNPIGTTFTADANLSSTVPADDHINFATTAYASPNWTSFVWSNSTGNAVNSTDNPGFLTIFPVRGFGEGGNFTYPAGWQILGAQN
ncbi:FG-GAP repeat domain-containing protein [Dyella japonica]|uniref:VCBS repeat-containing protein n=1 Tax=Dyella japonica DSM 16301 TaxID=1440762 RepID=A0A0G9GZH8_9GAMM|nr:VCBS repeat-containing protein [Dyella japonica]KLD62698.1 hypothetical protein Y882_14645 [Dyella japonica DSM 16301]